MDAYNSKSNPNNDISMVETAKPNGQVKWVGRRVVVGPQLRVQNQSGLAATKVQDLELKDAKEERPHSISKENTSQIEENTNSPKRHKDFTIPVLNLQLTNLHNTNPNHHIVQITPSQSNMLSGRSNNTLA